MNLARLSGRSRSVFLVLACLASISSGVAIMGCLPGQISPGGNVAPTVVINAPTRDVDVRSGDGLVVSYVVADADGDALTVSALYDVDGVADSGDEILLTASLPAGTQAPTIDTTPISPGTYYLYIVADDGKGGRNVVRASGRINVFGDRNVAFVQPNTTQVYGRSDQVLIQFSASEGINYVLFYIEEVDGERAGGETVIERGTIDAPTVKDVTWLLNNVAPGTYQIGLRYQDSLGVTETTYANGKVVLNQAPTIQVTKPGSAQQVYQGESIDVEYMVEDEDSNSVTVTVFRDFPQVFGNGNEIPLVSGPNEVGSTITYSVDTTSIPPGTWYFGAYADDGFNDPNDTATYAGGLVEVFSSDLSTQIQFILPDEDITVTPDGTFTISWDAEAPADGGDLRVEFIKLDAGGSPTGDPNTITEGTIAPNATTFQAASYTLTEGATYRLRIVATPDFAGATPVTINGPRFTVRSEADIQLTKPEESATVGTGGRLDIEWRVTSLESLTPSAQILLDRDLQSENSNEIEVASVNGVADPDEEGTFIFSGTLDLTATSVPFGQYYLYLAVTDGSNEFGAYGGIETEVQEAGAQPLQEGVQQLVIISVQPRVTGTYWMGDAGKDLNEDGIVDSLVFIGFDFFDSAGSLVAPLGDLNNDGYSDFLVVAQYAKPFRAAPTGDAYVIYGNGTRFAPSLAAGNVSTDPNFSILNLNSVGTTVPGVLHLGPDQVAVPDAQSSGIQSAMFIPDLTGDGIGELAFGIPYLHNSQSLTAWTSDNRYATEIVRAGQLRRGGVIVSRSENNSVPIISLDQIGQRYSSGDLPQPTAEEVNREGGDADTMHRIRLTTPNEGWSHPAGVDPTANDLAGPRRIPTLGVGAMSDYSDDENNEYEWHTTLNDLLVDGDGSGGAGDGDFLDAIPNDRCRYTGFLTGQQSANYRGSRVLGDLQNSRFGSSIDWWRGGLVASSNAVNPSDLNSDFPARASAGVVYYSLWSSGGTPPWQRSAQPSNYVIAQPGNYSHPVLGYSALILGASANAELSTVASLGEAATGRSGDFNGDGLDDLAIGSPGLDGGAGAAYIFYVRLPLPYVFDLASLNVANNNPNRRAGVQINGNAGDRLGDVIPDGLDFNGDRFADAVFGIPLGDADGGALANAGQVVLFYGGPQIASTGAGFSLDDVAYGPGLNAGTADPNKALGVVFEGITAGDSAGSAVAGVGDFDGDGLDDLAIAAPDATPRFDSDGDGTLDTDGVDLDGDGVADDLDGDTVPDPLTNAGVVYLIYGQRNTNAGTVKPLTGYVSLSDVITGEIPGAIFVGKTSNDALGGGNTTFDGTTDGPPARGFASAGDVDGDGRGDILISSVRASPLGNQFAGEVYLIYGAAPTQ